MPARNTLTRQSSETIDSTATCPDYSEVKSDHEYVNDNERLVSSSTLPRRNKILDKVVRDKMIHEKVVRFMVHGSRDLVTRMKEWLRLRRFLELDTLENENVDNESCCCGWPASDHDSLNLSDRSESLVSSVFGGVKESFYQDFIPSKINALPCKLTV